MEGIILDPLQVKDTSGATVNPATKDLQQTLQELIARLDTIAACKHHLTEAIRVQIAGSTTVATFGYDLTTSSGYVSNPAYARFLQYAAEGNMAAVQSNVQNVVV